MTTYQDDVTMLPVSEIRKLRSLSSLTSGGYTAGAFDRTIDKLRYRNAFNSVLVHVDERAMEKYESIIDYVFCETWTSPWKTKCEQYYRSNAKLLVLDMEFSLAETLWHDIAMSRLIIPICEKANAGERRYRWRRVVNRMRLCLIGTEAKIQGKPDFSRRGALQEASVKLKD